MIRSVDHVIAAVPDLAAAIDTCRSAGFQVDRGGRHEHLGTHNALVRFESGEYLELIAVFDEARSSTGSTMSRSLARRGAHWFGFALGTDDLAGDVERWRDAGFEIGPPTEGGRMRPDGVALAWGMALAGEFGDVGESWEPFLIQWKSGDSESEPLARLGPDDPPVHINGARGIRRLLVGASPGADTRDWAGLVAAGGQAAGGPRGISLGGVQVELSHEAPPGVQRVEVVTTYPDRVGEVKLGEACRLTLIAE